MGIALEEGRKGGIEGNPPVGSVIVRDGEVIGIGRNRVNSDTDPTAHAEVDAIRDACRKTGSTNLSGAVCYTSMEPCPMSCWAIEAAGCEGVVLGSRHAYFRGVGKRDYDHYRVESLMELAGRSLGTLTNIKTEECNYGAPRMDCERVTSTPLRQPLPGILSLFGLCIVLSTVLNIHAEAASTEPTVSIVAENAKIVTDVATSRVRTVEVHDVPSRGARTRLLVETSDQAAAIAVLFSGGKGATRISEQGRIGRGKNNFLIRSRTLFHNNSISTAVIDAPTDQPHDLRSGFRGSVKHAKDIGAVVVHLCQTFNLPVWLISTSRGTNSVANAATYHGVNGPDGIVLTASMLVSNKKGDQVLEFPLDKITGPTLIAHHEDDACHVTPPHKVPELVARLTNARPIKTLLYRNGLAQGNPCKARHYHGFNGLEETVVCDIANWIKAPSD